LILILVINYYYYIYSRSLPAISLGIGLLLIAWILIFHFVQLVLDCNYLGRSEKHFQYC